MNHELKMSQSNETNVFSEDNSNIERECVRLKTLSKMFDIPLWTLRAYAAQRRFEIIKINTRIYVNVQKFRDWLSKYSIEQR